MVPPGCDQYCNNPEDPVTVPVAGRLPEQIAGVRLTGMNAWVTPVCEQYHCRWLACCRVWIDLVRRVTLLPVTGCKGQRVTANLGCPTEWGATSRKRCVRETDDAALVRPKDAQLFCCTVIVSQSHGVRQE
jgi:hypothetical protein